jgi:hypothetical protein|uniref:Uncharacterized protein n=1 Tax=Picea glauca TaxID=3330 RepID=A0A124GMN0_PICGL|nr:hypothetical protein ABT39_MTgene1983 [Picea glauca]
MALLQIPVWEDNTALCLQGSLHDPPRKAVDLLPKFNGEGKTIAFEHIINYESRLRLLNIVQEDLVCRLFPFTLEGKLKDWYSVLPIE